MIIISSTDALAHQGWGIPVTIQAMNYDGSIDTSYNNNVVVIIIIYIYNNNIIIKDIYS